jgi:hypothetical protein
MKEVGFGMQSGGRCAHEVWGGKVTWANAAASDSVPRSPGAGKRLGQGRGHR